MHKENSSNQLSNQSFSDIKFNSLQYDETVLPTELECCYNEFKYHQSWAVSYQLQVLWQNSPKIDTI